MPRRPAAVVTSLKPLTPRDLSANFRAVADVTRLRILHTLWNCGNAEGVTVTDLCEDLRISQPLMSWHLRILRRAGFVVTHKEGRQLYCSVDAAVARHYGSALIDYLTAADAQPETVSQRAESRRRLPAVG